MNGMPMTAAICASNRKRSDQVGLSARHVCLFSTSWRILETGREDGAEMHESRLMDGLRRALVVVGALSGVAVLGAGVASAAEPVQLKTRLGNWCLDAPNGNNAATMVNACNGAKS